MIYRETGQFKANYQDDQALFPIDQDRYVIYGVLFVTFAIVPMLLNEYWLNAILLPFLIYALAALGLNILTGYCGQLSLGTGGFMAVGAYSMYKMMVAFPDIGIIPLVILSGLITAGVGTLFGLPSLRIKGFYLAVATLAAQFFLVWMFNKVGWFYNYSASGMITSPPMTLFGVEVTGPSANMYAQYFLVAGLVAVGPRRREGAVEPVFLRGRPRAARPDRAGGHGQGGRAPLRRGLVRTLFRAPRAREGRARREASRRGRGGPHR